MKIEMQTDTTQAKALLDAGLRQIPFTVALTLNRTAEEAVEAGRTHMRRVFTIRREFVPRQFRQFNKATKDKLETIVEITPRGGRFLRIHEPGGVRAAGVNPIAIPTSNLRPTRTANILSRLYPVQLGFFVRRAINDRMSASLDPQYLALQGTGYEPGSANIRNFKVREGPFHTFELTEGRNRIAPRQAGIYQRTGPGRGDVRLLWSYRRSVTIRPQLRFAETVQRVVADRWQENFRGFFDFAMRTAR